MTRLVEPGDKGMKISLEFTAHRLIHITGKTEESTF